LAAADRRRSRIRNGVLHGLPKAPIQHWDGGLEHCCPLTPQKHIDERIDVSLIVSHCLSAEKAEFAR
jgi:hypothetical protein